MSTVLPAGPNDVGIPKLLWSIPMERYLTFKEVFSAPVGEFRFDHLYEEAGVRVVDNSPDEIRDVATEMLDKIDGTVRYDEEDERLQARFKSLLTPRHYCYGAISRIGREFLRGHSSLV
jgi:putative glycosyltransferase (TIGR04372 family)